MFSDIRGFTGLSERLDQQDLLFVLTRYLTVMTRVVELFDGVVGEILGDGLLVFWNTPNPVPDHAAKACEAALAQQEALKLLNAELSNLGFPELAIRIGLHTGLVLSGNIGCETKMKFGCMGDPINLASRLEGLCKHYGVGVICSEATQERLPSDAGFFCRRLDLVRVAGKSQAVHIYELVGRSLESNSSEEFLEATAPVERSASISPCSGYDALVSATAASAGVPSRAVSSSSAAWSVSPPPSHAALATRASEACRTLVATAVSELLRERQSGRLRGWIRGSRHRGRSASLAATPQGESSRTRSRSDSWSPTPRSMVTVGYPVPEVVTAKQRCHAQLYEQALTAYQEARFLEALELAEAVLHERPSDLAARHLVGRCADYVVTDQDGECRTAVRLSLEEAEMWTGEVNMIDK
jgi:class 3 adenylate cyclase